MFFKSYNSEDEQNQKPTQPEHDEDEITNDEELEGVAGGNMPTSVEKPTDLRHGAGGGGGAGIIAV